MSRIPTNLPFQQAMLGCHESLDSKNRSANESAPSRCGTTNHPKIAKESRPGASSNPLDQAPAHALPITTSAGDGSDPIYLSQPNTPPWEFDNLLLSDCSCFRSRNDEPVPC